MDPLQALQAACADIKAKINAVLAGLPPLEQYEAASDMSYGIRSLTRYCNELTETAENLNKQAAGIVASITEKAGDAVTAAIAKLKEDKAFISAEDHTAAVTAAASAKEVEVRNAVTAERTAEQTIAARRTELIDAKTLPAVVAHKMPVKLLEGDGYKDNAAKVAERFKTLVESTGISAEATDLSEDQKLVVEGIAGLGLEEADETTFSTRMGLMKTAVTAARRKPAEGEIENPLLGSGGGKPAEKAGEDGFRPNLL